MDIVTDILMPEFLPLTREPNMTTPMGTMADTILIADKNIS